MGVSLMRNLALLISSLAAACAVAPCRGHGVTASVERLTVRAEAGALWVSASPAAEPHRLWGLPTSGAVRDLTLVHDASGYAVVFSQEGRSWRGHLGRDGGRLVAIGSAPAPDASVSHR